MRLAFTSCADPMDCKVQPVWNAIADLDPTPTHVLLLGDQIYMDYGLPDNLPWSVQKALNALGLAQEEISRNPVLAAPKAYSDPLFAKEMYGRYLKQWQIMSASRLFSGAVTPAIHGIWDDHDFGWNNSCGAGAPAMSPQKQHISRFLFKAFFEALAGHAAPAEPHLQAIENEGIELARPNFFSSQLPSSSSIELVAGHVYLHLLDCRTFRNNDLVDGKKGRFTKLLAENLESLETRLRPNAINLIASSTTLSGSKESWEHYSDGEELRQLRALANRPEYRIIVVSGDIHKNQSLRRLDDNTRLLEVTASGAARPLTLHVPETVKYKRGKKNYGIIDYDETSRKMKITLCSGDDAPVNCEDPAILWK